LFIRYAGRRAPFRKGDPEKEGRMKRWIIIFIASAWGLTSCAAISQPKTLTEIKEGLTCLPYERGMDWKPIDETLKAPDLFPLPDPGTGISRNARIFTHPVVILYLENVEFKDGEKIRFREVVNSLELCTQKR
jgi:hypothetical protein